MRIVEGVRGHVTMGSELVIRFDYGATIPWVQADRRTPASRSPARTRCRFRTPVEHRGENMRTIGEFTVRKGDRVPFALTWYPVERATAAARSIPSMRSTRRMTYWEDWSSRCDYRGKWTDERPPLADRA